MLIYWNLKLYTERSVEPAYRQQGFPSSKELRVALTPKKRENKRHAVTQPHINILNAVQHINM